MSFPSLARPALATHTVTKSTVAGVGIYTPSASAASAPLIQGAACTGVSHRVQVDQGLSTPSLAAGAARAALAAANVSPEAIELIVVGTTSPDVIWPSTACLVQTELGVPFVASFDLYAAQAGMVTALNLADRYIATGVRAALVIGAESDNPLVDLPRQTPPYGRAAGAIVLRGAGGDAGLLGGVVGGAATADGKTHDEVLLRGLSEAVDQCFEKAHIDLSDIDLVIGDQTAPEPMRRWMATTSIGPERLLLAPERYRGAFAAAPIIALHDALREKRLRPGMLALLISCGAGPAWAVACLRWGDGAIATW